MKALNANPPATLFDAFAADRCSAKARLSEAILRHVRRYPGAADSAGGIVQWWLPHAGYETAPDHMDEVLEELSAGEWLQAIKMPDGEILYRRGAALEL